MIVTGATNGIGEAAAIELARRGAHVGIVARNPRKAEATVERIEAAAPGAPVDVFIGDLAIMGDVRKVAAEMLDRYELIDVLVNNAGIQLSEQRRTSEGLPEMIAVNYLAPWLLTSLLRDRLVASAPARVVVTASEAHRLGWTIDPDTILTDTDAVRAGRPDARVREVEVARRAVHDGAGRAHEGDGRHRQLLLPRPRGHGAGRHREPGRSRRDRAVAHPARPHPGAGRSCARAPGHRSRVRDSHRRVHLVDPARRAAAEHPRRSRCRTPPQALGQDRGTARRDVNDPDPRR